MCKLNGGVILKFKRGKFFQNTQSREIQAVPYDSNCDYYDFIREEQKAGFRQTIITSDIMIKLSEYFLTNHNTTITSIDFLVDDEELQGEISNILTSLANNGVYWTILKDKLQFLRKYDSIDIKRINFTIKEGDGILLSLYVNGVFSISENGYDEISKQIAKLMGEYVR